MNEKKENTKLYLDWPYAYMPQHALSILIYAKFCVRIFILEPSKAFVKISATICSVGKYLIEILSSSIVFLIK